MPMSEYMRGVRVRFGPGLLLVPAVAAIIRDPLGDVLVLRKPSGAWDPGESPRAAVVREVREETGLEVVATRLVDVFGGADWRTTYENGDEVEYTVCVFVCEVADGAPRPDGAEIASVHWVAAERVPSLLELPYPAHLFR